jgi:hypothetical protein
MILCEVLTVSALSEYFFLYSSACFGVALLVRFRFSLVLGSAVKVMRCLILVHVDPIRVQHPAFMKLESFTDLTFNKLFLNMKYKT